ARKADPTVREGLTGIVRKADPMGRESLTGIARKADPTGRESLTEIETEVVNIGAIETDPMEREVTAADPMETVMKTVRDLPLVTIAEVTAAIISPEAILPAVTMGTVIVNTSNRHVGETRYVRAEYQKRN
ncbi:MAG: hypothetical protein PUF78_01660, partial [Lachnospiraceae bacterium]|nr:hypothetical protein [Lachnospiraceae bacterium]